MSADLKIIARAEKDTASLRVELEQATERIASYVHAEQLHADALKDVQVSLETMKAERDVARNAESSARSAIDEKLKLLARVEAELEQAHADIKDREETIAKLSSSSSSDDLLGSSDGTNNSDPLVARASRSTPHEAGADNSKSRCECGNGCCCTKRQACSGNIKQLHLRVSKHSRCIVKRVPRRLQTYELSWRLLPIN